MSSDDYWRVCKHTHFPGKFTAVRGFASDPEDVEPDDKAPVFDNIGDALEYAERTDPTTEYGIHIDRDCLHVIVLEDDELE